MEREIQIEGTHYRFSLERRSSTEKISIDGTEHEVRYLPLPDGRRLCIVDGKVVEWSGVPGGSLKLVRCSGRLHFLEVVDPRRRRGSPSSEGGGQSRAELKAPMAGRVVAVLCEAGEEIRAEQGVVVLEAMKMENELRSPIAGSVVSLEVTAGQSVETGQRVAVVESRTGDG